METIRALVEGFLRGRYGFRVATLAVPVLIGAILVVGWLLVGPSFAMLTIPRISPDGGGAVVRNGVAAVMVCGKKSGTSSEASGMMKGLGAATKYAPESGTGTWAPVRKGDCTVWYHKPPGFEQRYNRHQRAASEEASTLVNNLAVAKPGEIASLQTYLPHGTSFAQRSSLRNEASPVRACGYEVPAERWDFAMGMRKDCGIYGAEDPLVTGSEEKGAVERGKLR